MKSSCLPLCLLLAGFSLFWTPSAGLETLRLGSCVIATNLQEMQTEFSQIRDRMQAEDEIIDLRILKTESLQDTKPADQCCLLRLYLRHYLGTVFKNYQPLDQLILRKLSSLANSFLTIKKDLRLCHARMTCPCGEEAMEKFNQIWNRFKETVKALWAEDVQFISGSRASPVLSTIHICSIEVCRLKLQEAVVKALGELDILLQWMEEMR